MTSTDLNEHVQAWSVRIPVDGEHLDGDLQIPDGAAGMVLFAHGSGSSRHSVRNRFVARLLNRAGFATLLVDLLTPGEEQVDIKTRHYRFDIPLLAARLGMAINWLRQDRLTRGLPIGLFGASTGGGAALMAAAEHPGDVMTVVSRGGRPDLAGSALSNVQAPTLLIVGGSDPLVIELNREAMEKLVCEKRLAIISGATHLFEEKGKLEDVAAQAIEWFRRHLIGRDVQPGKLAVQ